MVWYMYDIDMISIWYWYGMFWYQNDIYIDIDIVWYDLILMWYRYDIDMVQYGMIDMIFDELKWNIMREEECHKANRGLDRHSVNGRSQNSNGNKVCTHILQLRYDWVTDPE